jgi:hypothetical protein
VLAVNYFKGKDTASAMVASKIQLRPKRASADTSAVINQLMSSIFWFVSIIEHSPIISFGPDCSRQLKLKIHFPINDQSDD